MNRQQKEVIVASFREMFNGSRATFLVNYNGVNVADMQELRRELRVCNGVFKITKARIMKIAASDIEGMDGFKDAFRGQVGLVFALDEVSSIAKKLVDFSKKKETFIVISAFFEKKVIDKEIIKVLASLPSREVLLAQVAAGLMLPVTSFVTVLKMIIIRFICLLQRIADEKK